MKIVSSSFGSVPKNTRSSKKDQARGSGFSHLIQSSHTDESVLDELFSDPDKVLENIFLLAEEVGKAGAELAEKPTPEKFFNYKKCIGLIVKGALKNMEIDDKIVQRLRRQAVYKTAQDIDTALADLARRILNDERNRIEILQLTNQLKGLILSILA